MTFSNGNGGCIEEAGDIVSSLMLAKNKLYENKTVGKNKVSVFAL